MKNGTCDRLLIVVVSLQTHQIKPTFRKPLFHTLLTNNCIIAYFLNGLNMSWLKDVRFELIRLN